MSDTQDLDKGNTLSVEAIALLGASLTSTEDLKVLRGLDFQCEHDDEKNSEFFAKKVISAYGDDMFSLHEIFLGEETSWLGFRALGDQDERKSVEGFWGMGVRRVVLEEIFAQCESLPMIILLYKSIPGEAEPGMDDDLHQEVFDKMLVVCKEDLKKLFILLKHLGHIEAFRFKIQARINEIAEK